MKEQYSQGQELTLNVERLGIHGEGVATHNQMTVFVDGALPKEKVVARVYEKRRTFLRAKATKILTPSPDRENEPICPLFGICGGCQVMHLTYEAQLKEKKKRVVDAFERIGKLPSFPVFDTVASPYPLEYRNKIALPTTPSLQLGLYKKGSHDIIPVEHCYIHTPLGENVFQKVALFIKEHRLSEVKHVFIKTAVRTKQVLLILVTKSSHSQKLKDNVKQLYNENEIIHGIIHNENHRSGNRILGDKFTLLAGRDSIEDEICSLKFSVSPSAFFQVNPFQAENLYQKAIDLAQLTKEDRLLDAYCGVGTLSLIAAPHVKEVIGVEYVKAAIENAQENALRNHIHNVKFTADLAERFIQTQKNIDVAFINPPRKGCERSFIDALIQLQPKTLIYISCDPATLARDLALLVNGPYKICEAHPFDMFPQTAHVETVVKLKI